MKLGPVLAHFKAQPWLFILHCILLTPQKSKWQILVKHCSWMEMNPGSLDRVAATLTTPPTETFSDLPLCFKIQTSSLKVAGCARIAHRMRILMRPRCCCCAKCFSSHFFSFPSILKIWFRRQPWSWVQPWWRFHLLIKLLALLVFQTRCYDNQQHRALEEV